MKIRSCLVLLTALLISSDMMVTAAPAAADSPVRKVTVTGSATLRVAPDEMNWVVQVSVNDPTLEKAKDRHDTSLATLTSYLKGLGASISDLQTGGIRFDRNLYPGDNSFAKENPFSCSTQVTFTLVDFDKYGPIADELSKVDGIQIQSVEYASSKEEATRRDAMKQAVKNAHDKANDIAIAADCYINKPLELVEQQGYSPRPMLMSASAMSRSAGGTPAPVPGQIEITAQILATYDLFYK